MIIVRIIKKKLRD